MSLKYDLFDVVSLSVMNNESIIIVEGKDDYQIYTNFILKLRKNVQIYQVNEFENYAEGCVGVINCIEFLQPKFEERKDLNRRILGIIDKDVRPFRGELPTHLKGLFVTKYYSIETYFATEVNIKRLIAKITYTPEFDITEDVLNFVYSAFSNSLPDLYLISLEALRNACTSQYSAVVAYSYSDTKICSSSFRSDVMPKLDIKKTELDQFANSYDIDINDLKNIVKGKWYIYWLLCHIYPSVCLLKQECRYGNVSQCRSCKVGNTNDCLYKLKQNTYSIGHLADELMTIIDEHECEDIFNALNYLF